MNFSLKNRVKEGIWFLQFSKAHDYLAPGSQVAGYVGSFLGLWFCICFTERAVDTDLIFLCLDLQSEMSALMDM